MIYDFNPISPTRVSIFSSADNPSTGRVDPVSLSWNNGTLVNESGDVIDPSQASASWCIAANVNFQRRPWTADLYHGLSMLEH